MLEKHKVRSRWVRMLSRCEDEDNPDYKNYGARGIYVCQIWHEFHRFYDWCVKEGVAEKLQIDRIDNNGPYSPENCRVVSREENMRNRRNTFFIEAYGERKTALEWIDDARCQVNYSALQRRVGMGWSPEDAISKPSGTRIARPHNEKRFRAFGEDKTLREWSQDTRCVVKYGTLQDRVNRAKWNIEDALTRQTGPQHGRQ